MAGWIISAHGSYQSLGTHLIFLNGKTVHFWTPDDRILANSLAWPLYEDLRAGRSVHAPFQYTDWVYNYVAHGTNDFPSGIFEVGSGRLIHPFKSGTDWSIASILAREDCPSDVYWLCCTEYAGTEKSGLQPRGKF